MNKTFELYSLRDVELYAKRQSDIYKQFLKALEGIIWGIRGTNQEITPAVVKEAMELFEEQYQICLDSLSETDMRFSKDLNWKDLYAVQNNHFGQVKKKFETVIKFGQAQVFHYFDAFGAIGLLAQRTAAQVQWRFTNKIGSKYDAIYAFRLAHRDFIYQALLKQIGEEKSKDVFDVVSSEGDRYGTVTASELADDNSEARKNWFHVNSQAWAK